MESRKILAWLCLYLIITCSLSTIFAIMAFIYIVFPSELLDRLLSLYFIGAPFVLFGLGIARSIPLSEYAYTKDADTNPATEKESLRYEKKKRKTMKFSLLLWTAGVTTIIGINPWYMFFFYFGPPLGMPLALSIMVFSLALLITIYKKQLRQYIKFNTN